MTLSRWTKLAAGLSVVCLAVASCSSGSSDETGATADSATQSATDSGGAGDGSEGDGGSDGGNGDGAAEEPSDGDSDASGDGGAASGGPIVIGAAVAQSGFMNPYDTPAVNAMIMAVEDLNAAGGINGQPVELKIIDTGSELDRYAPAATQLIEEDGAVALVVTCDYDVSSPAALVAQAANVVTIAPCVGDSIFGPRGGLELGFTMGNPTENEASIMAEFSYSQGARNAVLLTDTTLKYTVDQCDIFQQRFTELGGTIQAEYEFKQGDSIKETVSKIASDTPPDFIANCSYASGGASAAKELRDGGVDAPIVSGFGMDGDYWVGSIPGLKDYYIVTYASKNLDDPDPEVNAAAEEYRDKFGDLPSVGSFITGPSVIEALQTAYESAGSWDGDKITAALEQFDQVPLLVGPTSFAPGVHSDIHRPMRVLEVADGALKFLELWTAEKVAG